MAIGEDQSIITLNVNVLNSPIKRHREAEGIKQQIHFILPIKDSLKL